MSNLRIEELRRRIQKDPASIAFAQLAEEHRRAGEHEDAVRVCRAGLAQHPAYLSARITLGRALLELGRTDEAMSEFEYVLKTAPDNLTATRELADIHQRRRAALARSAGDAVPASAVTASAVPASVVTAAAVPVSAPVMATPEPPQRPELPPVLDPVLAELEAWLAVLTEERGARAAGI